ncbi:terpenoid cyclases/Protein prenyltransferase [Testicularia cyperi]|uniref:Protein farnesyltransferase subunit beta n=1 Tax=Testicularia cyperi TaxID=1882483 RepID=A0A317XYW0_9BASI|nr:terpenoid cyclases/Protein prenyltransferase [Testicularia cyperi]
MPAINTPAWPAPDDYVHSVTTEDQIETEQAIHRLFAPLRRPSLNFVQPETSAEPLYNPWMTDAEQFSTRHGDAASSASNLSNPQKLILERQAHVSFLTKLLEPLPGAYTAFDTNRSWLLYWILHSFDLLSFALDPKGRARAISTLLSFQNRSQGGFGGGPNQVPHLMSTYAAINALAIIGGPGPAPTPDDVVQGRSVEIGRGGWQEIDRDAIYAWMMRLKQPDGSFLVHENGEVDVRASYCVVCIASLLGISTPQLMRGMGEFVASCQTYEGGLAASSQPTYHYTSSVPMLSDLNAARPALGEAHGGYAFCSLATHLALSLYPDCSAPASSSPHQHGSAGMLDMDALVRWATSQQGIAIEGCGFRGRTNKLVDGCYGWFSGGGLFSVLSAVLENDVLAKGQIATDFNGMLTLPTTPIVPDEAHSDTSGRSWTGHVSAEAEGPLEEDEEEDLAPLCLYDRQGLQEYILVAAQRPGEEGGGLRDKPGKRPDAYHTCYNLAGLALAQHSVRLSLETKTYLLEHYKVREPPNKACGAKQAEWNKNVYASMLSWTLSQRDEIVVAGKGASAEAKANNRLNPAHPIFNITFPKAKAMMDWAYAQS